MTRDQGQLELATLVFYIAAWLPRFRVTHSSSLCDLTDHTQNRHTFCYNYTEILIMLKPFVAMLP